VVETNIHYPTDSSLLGDGARVLTRTMQKVEKAAGGLQKRIRNRMRSVNKKVIAIALAGRLKGPEGEERRVERYRELVSLTRKIVHQAEGVLEEMQHLPRRRQAQLKRLWETLETMAGRVRQVVRQTRARVFQWRTGCEGRISVLKRRHEWNRCRYRGFEGMQRWVDLGVIADNIIQIGRCLALQRA
jgi:IS5 family transposase